jgi:hypothetical protein
MTRRLSVTVVAGLMTSGCGGQAHRPDETLHQVVAWRTIGSWSGRGNRQTESFRSDTGTLRISWTTSSRSNGDRGGAGAFRVAAHSAISGRLLEQAVDHRGTGSGVGYVNQDPHVFYLLIESDGVNWTFSVDEAIAGTVTGGQTR